MPKTKSKNNLDRLAAVPLFEGLSKSELKAIDKTIKEEYFVPGDVLVREGDKGGRFFLITKGRAKLAIGGRTRKTIGPGDTFGEMALIDGEARAATVTAETDVIALTLTSWNFLALLEENWGLTRKVMADLCRRVRELDRSAN